MRTMVAAHLRRGHPTRPPRDKNTRTEDHDSAPNEKKKKGRPPLNGLHRVNKRPLVLQHAVPRKCSPRLLRCGTRGKIDPTLMPHSCPHRQNRARSLCKYNDIIYTHKIFSIPICHCDIIYTNDGMRSDSTIQTAVPAVASTTGRVPGCLPRPPPVFSRVHDTNSSSSTAVGIKTTCMCTSTRIHTHSSSQCVRRTAKFLEFLG